MLALKVSIVRAYSRRCGHRVNTVKGRLREKGGEVGSEIPGDCVRQALSCSVACRRERRHSHQRNVID